MAHISPAFPNVGDPNWGPPLIAGVQTVVDKVNTLDDRLLVVEANSGTAPPTTGTWTKGAIFNNSNPTPGGYIGWVCTTAGSPGTWKGFGLIQT